VRHFGATLRVAFRQLDCHPTFAITVDGSTYGAPDGIGPDSTELRPTDPDDPAACLFGNGLTGDILRTGTHTIDVYINCIPGVPVNVNAPPAASMDFVGGPK
jgi:hypothetical protein